MLITDPKKPPALLHQVTAVKPPPSLGETPEVKHINRGSRRLRSVRKKGATVIPEYINDADRDFLSTLIENGATNMIFSSEDEYNRVTGPTHQSNIEEDFSEPETVRDIAFYKAEAIKFGKNHKNSLSVDIPAYIKETYQIENVRLFKTVLCFFLYSRLDFSLEELNRTSVVAALALAL